MKSIKEFEDCQLELSSQKHISGSGSYCIAYEEEEYDGINYTWATKTDDDGNCISVTVTNEDTGVSSTTKC